MFTLKGSATECEQRRLGKKELARNGVSDVSGSS